jgi:Zn finger protein HypA/HybF involved in hydrogenase expression
MISTVKFECPACNQHMECERACSGDVIHCPGCGAQIRVPFHNPAELDGAVSRAELVAPAPPAAATHEPPPATTHHASEKREATVNCPACHAELKVVIPANSESASTTLLHTPGTPAPEPASASPTAAQSEHPDFAHMSLAEREKQIARAREAHPIQVNNNAKPRLEYVLEGKAPPPATND